MKFSWFILFNLVIVSRSAVAQAAPSEVIPEKVNYSTRVPKALKTFLPKGGKSRFWGETKLRFESKPVWAWVYDAKKTFFKTGESNTDGIQKSGLDLFVFSKPGRLKRISTTRFNYPRWGAYDRGGDFETVGLESTWLNLKTRTRPVLRVRMNNPHGLYGTITEDVLLVFDAGFKKANAQTGFGQGNSNGADYSSWNTTFVMDEAGQLNVIYSRGGSGGGRETTYKWQGKTFKPVSRVQSNELNGPMLPVPLTAD
ncbi:hypothetical protein EON80_06510 [bacterium]|nr:MAG: hypothetical protein EON80_06510 [bacterium]